MWKKKCKDHRLLSVERQAAFSSRTASVEAAWTNIITYPETTLNHENHLIIATVTLDDEIFNGTIESGTMRSVISDFLANDLGTKKKLPVNIDIKLADNIRHRITEALVPTIRLGNKVCKMAFLIFPDAVDALIQVVNFVAKMGTLIICGGQTLALQEETLVNDSATLHSCTDEITTGTIQGKIERRSNK